MSWWAAKSRSAWVSIDMSVPLGKYWRSRPLVFSLEYVGKNDVKGGFVLRRRAATDDDRESQKRPRWWR